MATGQTILNLMEVLHPELQLQSGENDVTKGLIALNAAQDYMESVFALQPDLLGDTTGTMTTAANTEKTAFPSGLLRVDKVQFLDSVTLLPVYDLKDIRETGGHLIRNFYPPFVTTAAGAAGVVNGYWTDGRFFYWVPIPDATYTLRWYGFQPASDVTASGTFGYPDICMLPMAVMAVKIERTGLDDDPANYTQLAQDTFEPVVAALGNFQRERAPGFQYRYMHNT